MSRVQPLQAGQAPAEVEELYNRIQKNGAKVINLYKVLAYNTHVMRDFLRLGSSLLTKTELSPKLRELAILRIAKLTGSEYEWAQHYPIALEVGVGPEQAKAIAYWDRANNFNDMERAVLRYTDEVLQDAKVKDENFNELRQHLNTRNIVELTVSIGYWEMVARLLEALKVDMDSNSISSAEELFGSRS